MTMISRPMLVLAAALAAAAPAVAAGQRAEPPLGDILDALPPPEDEAPAADKPVAPIVRPAESPVRAAPPLPEVAPGTVGTTALPPSAPATEEPPAPPPPVVAVAAPPAPVGARVPIDWAAVQEQRRQAVNAVEAPVVARLNADIAARQEATRQEAEAQQIAYQQSLAERDAGIAEAQAAHEAAVRAHEARVARERAAYEAQVAACLDGQRDACAPR